MNSNRSIRPVSIFFLLVFLFELISPTAVWALSGGPTQPEFSSFAPVDASNLVDPFTGDMSYNVPLFEIGGYPINLVYNSNSNMESEASWVGLNWTLNPGAINRDVRGIPDDFKGEAIVKEVNIRPNWTAGLSGSFTGEIAAVEGLNVGVNLTATYNNYKGLAFEKGLNVSYSLGIAGSSGMGFSGGLGISSGPNGISSDANLGLKLSKGCMTGGIGLAGGMNSREGLRDLTLTKSISGNINKNSEKVKNAQTKLRSAIDKISGGTIKTEATKSFNSQISSVTIGTSSMSFGFSPPYQPSNYQFLNTTKSYRATFGGEIFPVHPNASVRGFYTLQKLKENTINESAYGALYLEDAPEDAILDYSKEKNVPINKNTTNLPIPYQTSDMFSIMAQGVGGQFRFKRGDNGVFHTPERGLIASGLSLGAEVGLGNLFHVGADVTTPTVENTSGKWTNMNVASGVSRYIPTQNDAYQPSYLYNTQELTVQNFVESEAELLKPMRPTSHHLGQQLALDGPYSNTKLPSAYVQDERIPNKTVMSFLNAKQADVAGFQKTVNSYEEGEKIFGTTNSDKITKRPRIDYPNHHISEITVTKEDGMRYIFGIPTYNGIKKEATFNIDDNSSDLLAGYSTDVDNSMGNTKGKDYFFERTTTPAYATSYLLTAVASPDYIDVQNDGISSDDIGNLVQFNYTKVYSNYRWRTPYEQGKVNNTPGFNVVDHDNKGSYLYGEKELWLNHSIESKDQIAFFYASKNHRTDAVEVAGENGGYSSTVCRNQFRLDSIEIYSKADLIANPTHSVPIKTVHFRYSYTFVQDAPNNIGALGVTDGKQTLSRVFFTYGKSKKGKLNPYIFEYFKSEDVGGNDVFDNTYHNGMTDRWGNYKKENQNGMPLNAFPYTEQDTAYQNAYSRVGQMKSISLPSGSRIDIDYESDDYAYVNDLPAGEMTEVIAMGSSPYIEDAGDELNEVNALTAYARGRLYFKLATPVEDRDELFEKYLKHLKQKQIYFDFAVDINNQDIYDRVKGYFEFTDYGIVDNGDDPAEVGWIAVKQLQEDGILVHPVSIAALQTLRMEMPEHAYPGSYVQPGEISPLSFIANMASSIANIVDMLVGFNKTRLLQGKCNTIKPEESFIRLQDPDRIKLGGGNRVKKVTVSDQIDAGYYKLSYGQLYDYRIYDDASRSFYSAGVASYEPFIGGEDNLARRAISQNQKVKLAPDNFYYFELPYGEQLFPSPSVGYSQVKITSFGVGMEKSTGYQIKKFFTSKDYPTISSQTMPDVLPQVSGVKKLFNVSKKTYFSAVQGYSVIVNDMHGKPKSEEVYNAMKALISKTEYQYDDMVGTTGKIVSNAVDVVDAEGNISNGILGVDMELYQEYNESATISSTPGLMGNVDAAFYGPILIPIPIPLNLFSKTTQTTRIGVVTKFVKKAGVLRRIIVTDDAGAVTTTENLLFDKATGNVLLTSINDAFGRKTYTLSVPAHWNYSSMGMASQNLGLYFNNISMTGTGASCHLAVSTVADCFEEGDEVVVQYLSGGYTNMLPDVYYAIKSTSGTNLVTRNYHVLPAGSYNMKIRRSGNRNLLGQNVATIVSMDNPVNTTSNKLDIEGLQHVLNATAIEFDDYNKIDCGHYKKMNCPDTKRLDLEDNNFYGFLAEALINYALNYDHADDPALTTTVDILDFFQTEKGYMLDTAQYNDLADFNLSYISNGMISNSIVAEFGNPGEDKCRMELNFDRIGLKFLLHNEGVIGLERSGTGCTPTITAYDPCTLGVDLKFDNFLGGNKMYFPIALYGADGTKDIIGLASFNCTNCSFVCTYLGIGDKINPYSTGLKGNWKPKRSYSYMSQRTRPLNEDATAIYEQGAFSTWKSFWEFDETDGDKFKKATTTPNWTWPNEVTLRDNRGNELEDRDTLNRYSAALYTYDNNFNTAVASNSRYQQVANDHFEDYGFDNDQSAPCFLDHWSFKNPEDGGSGDTTSFESHTGRFSMEVDAEASLTVKRQFDTTLYRKAIERNEAGHYILNQGDCLKQFSPLEGQYIISGWLKPSELCLHRQIDAGVTLDNDGSTLYLQPKGPFIEGWQRFEGVFSVGASQPSIDVSLTNNEAFSMYFDDVRIHPVKSNMKSFVYDSATLRLMATLDENNYATFYEYDAEGKLIRIKRETERGIITVKENRQELSKILNP